MVNAASCNVCSRCGCPARPTYAQISSAKAAAGIVESCEGPTGKELLELVTRPLKKPVHPATATLTELGVWGALLVFLKACSL